MELAAPPWRRNNLICGNFDEVPGDDDEVFGWWREVESVAELSKNFLLNDAFLVLDLRLKTKVW